MIMATKAVQYALRGGMTHTMQRELDIVHSRVGKVGEEVRVLKVRVAWMGRDILQLQTDVARRQVILRGCPR